MQKDFLRKISDPPLKICPECGKETLYKMVTAAGFQLKGTGWYATDFKGGAKPAATNSEDAPATSGEEKSQSKTEAKTETKAETKPVTKTETAAPAA
jgi:putative FmdB family regulatory protein